MFDTDRHVGSIEIAERRVKHQESPIPANKLSRQVRRRMRRTDGEIDLDSDEMLRQHAILLALYRRELDRQMENRAEQSVDEDFYDNIQWDEQEAQTLKDRAQVPLVYNVISTSINWVTGTEKRSRIDYKILPRTKEDAKPAERKTALLKYLSDVNRSPFARSRAFEDSVKVGVGWLECGVEDNDTGDPVYDRYESWRNMLWDSACTENDISDARFVSRSKWVDADILKALFPGRSTLIAESVDNDNIYAEGTIEGDGDEPMDSRELAYEQDGGAFRDDVLGHFRPRVRAIEMWFRKPEETYKLIGGSFAGDLYDFSDAQDEEIRSGRARVEKKKTMRMCVAIFTARGMIYYGESPYRHNRYPFTPVWGNRRGRDGMPYGLIRGLRDIQSDINKRASKALYILSSNKVVMDEGALSDKVSLDEFAEEVARPDGIIIKKQGKELDLNVDRDLAPAHLELMSRSIAMIQQQSGVTDELLGRTTNATSGIAIQRRQNQGTTTTSNYFENLRFAIQVHGEKQLSLTEQFYNEEKSFRITSQRGTPEYVTLNSGLPEDDITRSKADFVISEADWHATMRQSAAESLLETMKTLPPEIAVVMLDLVIENMDLPNRDEIVKRIRAATGMMDPDADPDNPSPEEMAAQQAKAKMQAMQQAMMEAELAEKIAKAKHSEAQAKHAQAQVRKVLADVKATLAQVVGANTDSQNKAIEAAMKMLSAPVVASVADYLLTEAGFQGEPERQAEAAAMMDALAQAEAAAAEQAGQMQQPPPGIGAPQSAPAGVGMAPA